MAERYGWSLEYIENLTPRRLAEESAVRDALARFQEHLERKARRRMR